MSTIVSRLLKPDSWKSALAEVLLIIVGVSIALAGDAWWADRQERVEEAILLRAFSDALHEDLIELQERLDILETAERETQAILNVVQSGSQTQDLNFGALVTWRWAAPNRGPYETLKSRGYELISDDSLRQAIASHYEDTVLSIVNETFWRYSNEIVMPYFLEKMIYTPDGWRPDDYEGVIADRRFINLCGEKIDRLNRFVLPTYRDALADTSSLIEMIEGKMNEIE